MYAKKPDLTLVCTRYYTQTWEMGMACCASIDYNLVVL